MRYNSCIIYLKLCLYCLYPKIFKNILFITQYSGPYFTTDALKHSIEMLEGGIREILII